MTTILRAASALACAALCAGAHAATENYAFAISWQPAFCETHASKAECKTETSTRFDAAHFTLHGLWPQGASYCGVSSADKAADNAGQWSQLPPVILNSTTQALLQVEMPGTMSYLDRHEWTKHGTCSGEQQQDYFAAALNLLDNVNAGQLAALVGYSRGDWVWLGDLAAAAQADFGSGAGRAVEFLCTWIDDTPYLSEVRLHLALPRPLPSQIQPSYLVPPRQPASSQQRCPSDWIYVDVANH